jgi:hypothetical protein
MFFGTTADVRSWRAKRTSQMTMPYLPSFCSLRNAVVSRLRKRSEPAFFARTSIYGRNVYSQVDHEAVQKATFANSRPGRALMRNQFAMLTDGIADFLAFPPQAGVFRAVQLDRLARESSACVVT